MSCRKINYQVLGIQLEVSCQRKLSSRGNKLSNRCFTFLDSSITSKLSSECEVQMFHCITKNFVRKSVMNQTYLRVYFYFIINK